MASGVQRGGSLRERRTSAKRAENERRTISKFAFSVDVYQAFFFVQPNKEKAF